MNKENNLPHLYWNPSINRKVLDRKNPDGGTHACTYDEMMGKRARHKQFENIVRKGEHSGNPYFHLFLQYFLPIKIRFQFLRPIYPVV